MQPEQETQPVWQLPALRMLQELKKLRQEWTRERMFERALKWKARSIRPGSW
jgi:hypothetical protein